MNFHNPVLKKSIEIVRHRARLILVFVLLALLAVNAFRFFQIASAQNQIRVQTLPPTLFRVGERLTYNISFEKFNNAAYAEIYAVSRGKLGEKDAVEIHSKIKTSELVSAAFYLLDETRTTYASSDSGLPLYIRKTSNAGISPKETVDNFLVNPTAYNDLLTLVYQARNASGAGSFTLQEDGKIYNVVFQNTVGKRLKTAAGEFETSFSTVQSDFFTEKGITNLSINFSTDAARIPVLIQFKTAKGDFRAEIASVQTIEPETAAAEPTPIPIQTPRPQLTPKPVVTPAPYIDNQPLAKELPFQLGETLEYQVSTGGLTVFLVTLQAKERKQFSGQDSLLLTATVIGTDSPQPIFKLNDTIQAQVNPESLAPQKIELKLSGALAAFNQQVIFDQRAGSATNNKGTQLEIPVGTHSILSLAYAVRSFNLKPSKDLLNPVNDTRVAVFLDTQAYVFTLRPSNAELINLQGERVSAQLISISTGNPNIDQYNMRLWLSNDDKRLPLRLIFGNYQADLVSEKQILPK